MKRFRWMLVVLAVVGALSAVGQAWARLVTVNIVGVGFTGLAGSWWVTTTDGAAMVVKQNIDEEFVTPSTGLATINQSYSEHRVDQSLTDSNARQYQLVYTSTCDAGEGGGGFYDACAAYRQWKYRQG